MSLPETKTTKTISQPRNRSLKLTGASYDPVYPKKRLPEIKSSHAGFPKILNCILVEGQRPYPRVAILFEVKSLPKTTEPFARYLENEFSSHSGQTRPRSYIKRFFTIHSRELKTVTEIAKFVNQKNSSSSSIYLLCTSANGLKESKLKEVVTELYPDSPYIQNQVKRSFKKDNKISSFQKSDSGMHDILS